MSGTDHLNASEGVLNSLERLLKRESPLSAFNHVAKGLSADRPAEVKFEHCAVCFDSNILLNLSKIKEFEDILDYFSTTHKAPLLISAQSLLEFWNNHISAVETISAAIEKRFGDLEREILKVDADFGEFASEFGLLMNKFKQQYGHVHDKAVRGKLIFLVERLADAAMVCEVPRSRFHVFASSRQSTKTPPGFRDSGDGDFFVWIDFLFGLGLAMAKNVSVNRAILVTDDRKSDWSRGGVPHPVLAAEVQAFVNVQLETWTLEALVKKVQSELDKGGESETKSEEAEPSS